MLQKVNIPIDFGTGIDTKTDPKLVLAGKLLDLKDGVFTKAKQLRKRNGYTALPLSKIGGGTLADPRLFKAYKEEALVQDSGFLYSYSEDLLGWVNKGKYQSIQATDEFISRGAFSETFVSAAISGSVSLRSWTANGNAYANVVDVTTNTLLLPDTRLGGTQSVTRSCLLGASTLGVFFTDTSGNLFLSTLNISLGGGLSFNSAVTIATDLVADGSLANFPFYDVANTSTGAVVSWAKGASFSGTPTGMSAATIDTVGTITHTATVEPSGRDGLIRCFVGINGNIWFYWVEDTTTTSCTLFYSVLSSTLTVVLAKTTIQTGINTPSGITALKLTSTSQTVYYSTSTTSGTHHTSSSTVTSGGSVGAVSQVLAGVTIACDPFSVLGNSYIGVGFLSNSKTQSTFFLLDLADLQVVAKAFYPNWAITYPPTQALSYSFSKVAIPVNFTEQLDTQSGITISQTGSALAVFEFSAIDASQAVNAGGLCVLNGGVISMYDGSRVVELGFNLFPEPLAVADSGSGTGPGAGTYIYFGVYRWFDAQGNMHQSAPSPFSAITIANTNAIQVSMNYLYLTQKVNADNPVQLLVYRTTNGGTVPFLITSITDPFTNDPLSDALTFTDSVADSTLILNEIIYSNSLVPGGVVENIAPPPSLLMALHNNRVWLVNSETQEIWYCKSIQPGVGLSFSDLFVEQIDQRGGEITAIAEMDANFVIFKGSFPFIQGGDGFNDTGQSSTLTTPQVIPSDAGCNASKSVILFPHGLLFKSDKGFYLLDRSLGVSYVGMPVETFNAQSVTSATLLDSVSQIRFLTDSGFTLVFDYIYNQWGTFTNHTGYASDIWNGTYVYTRTDHKIYEENLTSFLDDTSSYALTALTGWMDLQSVQGFQRVWRFLFLGDFANGTSAAHGISVSAFYDFSTVALPAQSFVLGNASASGVFQYRDRLIQLKCGVVQLLIQETVTGQSGEFIDFTNIEFEVGLKKGAFKASQTNTVG